MSEINLEFLLGAMPTGVATLYRVLRRLAPGWRAGQSAPRARPTAPDRLDL